MRLIDADALADAMFEQRKNYPQWVANTIGEMPVIDAVPVVRCKDCKHWYFADNRIPSEQENVCGRNGIVVTPDWFCADGERQDGR